MDQSASSAPPSSSASTTAATPAAQPQEKNTTSGGGSTPTPEAELNPQKVKILLLKLKEEMYLAKTTTKEDEKKKHLETAEKIKRILVMYQQQQQAKANSNSNLGGEDKASGTPVPSQQINNEVQNSSQLSPSNQPQAIGLPQQSSQAQLSRQPLPPAQPPAVSSPPVAATTTDQQSSESPAPIEAPTPQRPTSRPQQQVTLEKYNNVRSTLKVLFEKIKTLETTKNAAGTTDETKQEIDKQLAESRSQLQKYHTAALHMRNLLIEQGRLSANSTPVNSTPNTAASTPTIEKSSLIKAEELKPTTKPQAVAAPSTSKSKQKSQSTTNIPLSKTTTAGSTTGSAAAALTRAASTTKLSRPGLALTPTSATTPTAASTLSAANKLLLQLLQQQQQPLQPQQQTVDPNVTPSNIPDNDGRVLTKRKLTELINNISVDQGDVKIPIDNDVEDLFLDLADDFVRNIVEFSGRLAKHRKLDKIDLRDVQLNLERNWGLRVPGYSTDEIKAARKWQANPEYIEKLHEVAKSNSKD
ncbi:hypothetical protein Cantr_00370 [Candida viswanathii]|uniref:Transcription initiation factor TFIID subunit 12 domain-containing protein n=1 Tax=Candida viswanathii TaxID=5486 RepID=A0A367YF92_9ASCO|nr:hypothetical protein Cantr_00370 [Candida viswanathii]